jgi:UMF1 family MFS transporter
VATVVAPSIAQSNGVSAGLSATGEPVADRRGQISWALFEFARSPYLSLVYIYVFAPYFASTVIGDPVRGQEVWSFANTIVGVCVALLAPLLGAISDRTGARKPWLLAIVAIMAPGCFALWWAMPGAQGGLPIGVIVVLIIVLASCFQFSDVFHSAMLPSLASPARVGGLSGLGIATGNAGTLLALVAMLFCVALPASKLMDWAFLPDRPLFGLDPEAYEHNRIAGPVAGVWMMIFVIPLMLWTPDRPRTGVSALCAVREGLGQLALTVKRARQYSNVGLYLLARMLFTDGNVAIIAYAGIYAAGVFGWDLATMLLFGLSLSPFAIFGGLLGGWVDNRFGSKRAIQISVGCTCIGMLGAVSTTPNEIFFVFPYDAAAAGPIWSFPYFQTLPEIIYVLMFMLLSATVTAAFGNSRAMMARIAPVSMMSQFFGLYGLSGTATAFLGHGFVAFFTRVFHNQRAGFASTIVLLTAGLVLLKWVREERAEEAR